MSELMGTRDKIIKVSGELFQKKGYDGVSMREIAGNCGIAVGNLQYYFPRKIQIIAEIYRTVVQRFYENPEFSKESADHPIVRIMACEYAFILHSLGLNADARSSYVSILGSSEICDIFVESSTQLFLDSGILPDSGRLDILMANKIMFGGLREVLDFYLNRIHEYSLDDLMTYLFRSRLGVLGITGYEEEIREGIRKGRMYQESAFDFWA